MNNTDGIEYTDTLSVMLVAISCILLSKHFFRLITINPWELFVDGRVLILGVDYYSVKS